MRWSGCVAAVALWLCGAVTARAMCSRTSFAVLAWNPAGTAVLLEKRQDGPEGGGALSYVVFGFAGNQGRSFSVSSDFSPGDGSTPETVTAAVCRQNVGAANALLKELGFAARLKADDAACGPRRRGGVTGGGAVKEAPAALVAEVQKALALPSGVEAWSTNGQQVLLLQENGSCMARCVPAAKNARSGAWEAARGCVTGPGQ